MQIHSEGFRLGVLHGKFIGAKINENLALAQGQLNGAKYGWLSGFEQG